MSYEYRKYRKVGDFVYLSSMFFTEEQRKFLFGKKLLVLAYKFVNRLLLRCNDFCEFDYFVNSFFVSF